MRTDNSSRDSPVETPPLPDCEPTEILHGLHCMLSSKVLRRAKTMSTESSLVLMMMRIMTGVIMSKRMCPSGKHGSTR